MIATASRLALFFLASLLAAVFFAPAASASEDCFEAPGQPGFGIAPGCFDGQVSADEAGDPFSQAAGHPYAGSSSFRINSTTDPIQGPHWPVAPFKNVIVDLPPGFVGNSTVLGRCTLEQLADKNGNPFCPPSSQAGQVLVTFNGGLTGTPAAVYNMVPPPGVPARFAFAALGTILTIDAQLRSDSDYGLSLVSNNTPEVLALLGLDFTFWGTPGAAAHDSERWCAGGGGGGPRCSTEDIEPPPFLRNPTACTEPGQGLQTTISIDSWFEPGVYRTASFTSHEPPAFPEPPANWGAPLGPSGCEKVPFDPAIALTPTTHAADSPSGLEVDLTVPQPPTATLATSDLKKAVVTLPAGMSVNPASAGGLGACGAAQIGLIGAGFGAPNPIHFDEADPSCPNSSKLGTVTIETPLLEDPLQGAVYLAKQGDNPFGSLLAMYIVAEGSGVIVKLPGRIGFGPDGRLIATFDNQPQTPFEKLHLDLFGGPAAPLRTPPSCGTHTTTAELSPWARPDQPVGRQSSFEISSGPNGSSCPKGSFDPKLAAGTANPLAATYSPFNMRLSRADGTQEINGLGLTLPPGLAAKFAGIPYCPESALGSIPTGDSSLGLGAAQLAAPACSAASQVGTVTVGAGAGSNPFYVDTGRAYLAGRYKGAPLSLAIVTPAVAGPFDLGNVVVRTAVHVDPATAQGRAVSDPIPTSLQGIQLDLRDLRVNLDRPDFTLNPTSCDPMAIEATATGALGASATLSQRFQVGGCERLAFKPKLSFRLKGGTSRGANPSFSATLKARPGDANIARAVVSLPHSEFLDQAHIGTICTRVQYAADACPARSVYGYARAVTPLLDRPLAGPVYLRSSSHNLPDLVASLEGQIHIDLVGRIDSVNGGIRNTFEAVPDAPVSKFTLTMKGGKKGLLQNSTNLCAATHRASVQLDGQNGKVADSRPALKADCGKAKHGKRGK